MTIKEMVKDLFHDVQYQPTWKSFYLYVRKKPLYTTAEFIFFKLNRVVFTNKVWDK